ncbi:MAG: toll/interleukin-1 receptor domain-containing protein [Nitrosopumilaceae archaeon]
MVNSPVDTFLSHAHDDRIIARKLADELKKHAFDSFVAHDDINLGDEWESAIFERIKKCDLFIAILSNNFRKAKYTDHEVGIAYGLGKVILPLSIDETMPYGFMTKFQAKKVSPKIDVKEISKIFKEFMPKTPETRVENHLVYALVNARSFDEANYYARMLSQYPDFSDTQINLIAEGFLFNDQISGAYGAAPWCVKILKKNLKRVEKKYQERLKHAKYTSDFYE